MITVLSAGDFSTVQDAGRPGYQAWGMPLAGALDPFAFYMANLLVGNEFSAATVEMIAAGASFHFDNHCLVALCGADMQPMLDGIYVKNWASFWVEAGSKLVLNKAVGGRCTYMAVSGGIDVPLVMGSRSTYIGAAIGGLEGRCLQQGDAFDCGQQSLYPPKAHQLPKVFIPQYRELCELHFMFETAEFFSPLAKEQFLAATYILGPGADRISYPLLGPKIFSKEKPILSEPSIWGTVEIPDGKNPIIAAPDHGTARGFAKMGYVAQSDFSVLAQIAVGAQVRFIKVTRSQAIKELTKQKARREKAREVLYQSLHDYR